MKTKRLLVLAGVAMALSSMAVPSSGATQSEIAASIEKGVAWLVSQQNLDGSWSGYYGSEPVAGTAFAVVKLEERAFELGYASPFDAAYPYHGNVISGLNYLFSQAGTYGPGSGICFARGSHETYSTGVSMMAIAASRDPSRVVAVAGSVVNGWTYGQVLQANVDFFAVTQNPDGGWRYWWGYQPSDNSNTGYAVLGLRYAEAPAYGFACVIPASIKTGLNAWIATIQDPINGGSWYDPGWPWINLLKTGNLLFEMSFCGDGVATPRVQNALNYIQNNWNVANEDPGWRPHHYQSMYCLMKGFASLGIESITVGGNPVDWFAEFATAIVGSQQADGSWPGDYWGDAILATEWALLVLEKVAPPPPVDVKVLVPSCACDTAGYVVTVQYSVERFVVDGTLKVYEDATLVDTVLFQGFTGSGTWTHTVATDTPGTHTWKAVLDVVPVGGGTPAHAEDEASLGVCETPKVAGIPDQVAPFQTFDLDDYLTYGGGLAVTWTASGVPADWTVAIDPDNVVTVTSPTGANDPATITFTASVTCCEDVVCAGSDDAVFTPNQPPDCSGAYPSIAVLWPPNNKFVAVQVLGVTDPDGDPVTITITAIKQDEPVDTFGDGSFTPDGQGVDTATAQLRAERSGTAKVPGDGRVYHVFFTAADGRGGACSGEVLVNVPHDMNKPVIDGGALYDSTALTP